MALEVVYLVIWNSVLLIMAQDYYHTMISFVPHHLPFLSVHVCMNVSLCMHGCVCVLHGIFFLRVGFLKKFIYFCLRWVFVAVRGLSLVAGSGGYSSLRCVGFSLQWLLLLRSTGSRCAGFSNCGTQAQ